MAEPLSVLGSKDLSAMVFEHLLGLAAPLFEKMQARKQKVQTADDVLAHQRTVRETFTELIGGLPERTPLNPRRVGRLQRSGYAVEKVVFESRPHFYVSANLYLPGDRRGLAPAILVPCGHAREGKASPNYQRLAQGLVKHGFVVLVYDPLGQGERSQYWDYAKGDSRIGLCCPEHEFAGTQSLLVGVNLASYRIWDGMRALDYLCTRDEVDVARLGCTGCSGGGTLTTYLVALDERIRAAMPVCYVTSRDAWLATGMIADAEQVQDHAIERGIDHSDLLIAGAPRAIRIGAASGDFFPIEGTRRAFAELKRMYALLGVEGAADLVVAEGEHGYSQPLREAACQWFRLWLGDPSASLRAGPAADAAEPSTEPEPVEELWCAPDGQVNSLGSRTVFCFTRERALALPPAPPELASRGEAEEWQGEMRSRLLELLNVPAGHGAPSCDQLGLFYRGKCGIEQLTFQSERGITVPALLFVPDKEPQQWPGIVYVHQDGKEAEAGPTGTIQMLASEGNVVLAIDVRGIGETHSIGAISRDYAFMGTDGYHFYQYGMLGHALVGRRVHDVLRALALLAERPEVDTSRLSIVGQGSGGLLALFAAALDGRVGTAVCCQSLLAYRDLATHEFHSWRPPDFVSGILPLCDLPEVAACIAPRRLVLAGPVDHMRRCVPQPDAEAAYAFPQRVYQLFEADENLVISAAGA
ncbi:MAG TPA: acetylxylan esterase [Planctomycetota bacterium]|nr:acetylxylan esterase [Planctomycetota bacterium]